MVEMSAIRRRVYLRVLRWRIRLRYMSLAKFWGLTVAFGIIVIPIWRHVGTDTALPILADATPILLAIVGVVMSYIQPKRESHRATTFILIVAGLLGSAVLSANRIRSEAEHHKEVKDLGRKMDVVRDQNTNLSNFLLAAKNTGMSEADRKKGIETTLRNEYILSHDPIDPDILAGTKMPPEAWINKRLHDLGETWTISEETPRMAASPRSSLVLSGNPRFTGPNTTGIEGGDFLPGYPLGFNIHYKNTGPNAVQLGDAAAAAYLMENDKPETQEAILTQFTNEITREKKAYKGPKPDASHAHTMGAGTEEFFTAYGWTDTMEHSMVSQDDLDKLKAGEKIAFVIAQISYKDFGAIHHFRVCMWLQPPAASTGIWHFCNVFNASD